MHHHNVNAIQSNITFVILQFCNSLLWTLRIKCSIEYFLLFYYQLCTYSFYICRIFKMINGDFSFLQWWLIVIFDLIKHFLIYWDCHHLGFLQLRNFIGSRDPKNRDTSAYQISAIKYWIITIVPSWTDQLWRNLAP